MSDDDRPEEWAPEDEPAGEWNDCGHDRAKVDDVECPECGADLSAIEED